MTTTISKIKNHFKIISCLIVLITFNSCSESRMISQSSNEDNTIVKEESVTSYSESLPSVHEEVPESITDSPYSCSRENAVINFSTSGSSSINLI